MSYTTFPSLHPVLPFFFLSILHYPSFLLSYTTLSFLILCYPSFSSPSFHPTLPFLLSYPTLQTTLSPTLPFLNPNLPFLLISILHYPSSTLSYTTIPSLNPELPFLLLSILQSPFLFSILQYPSASPLHSILPRKEV